jgi:hypothetical protein
MHFSRLILFAFALGTQAAPLATNTQLTQDLSKRHPATEKAHLVAPSTLHFKGSRPQMTSEENLDIMSIIKTILPLIMKMFKK